MSVLDKVRVIVYRFHEKGLEIFLVNADLENDPDVWRIPEGSVRRRVEDSVLEEALIRLDPVRDENGDVIRTIAIEGDWHDIPSIRGLIKYDVKLVTSKIKEMMPGIEKGAFFAVKEAFKKVMPNEYANLKELKEILVDRNVIRYM